MKLFNKLNEQLNVNRILNKEITEAELSEAEKSIIFENDGRATILKAKVDAIKGKNNAKNPDTEDDFNSAIRDANILQLKKAKENPL